MNSKSTNNESPAALLPCPWCRGLYAKKVGRCIECTSCGASGPEMARDATYDEYVHVWNSRASTAPAASESVWRCTQCGELLDEINPAWRWTGSIWQHHHERAGHVDAQRFAASESRWSVPEGFALVPKEPTDEMLEAAYEKEWEPFEANTDKQAAIQDMRRDYRALIAAAPTPPAVASGEPPDWAIAQAFRDTTVPAHDFAVVQYAGLVLKRANELLARSAAAKGEGQEKPR